MAEYLASIFGTEKDKVNCSFYFKIGACRHGDRCSRLHNKPTFSQEVFTELQEKYGEIEEMNVCDNLGDHLVGNVYVKFRREEDAERAVAELNNRWFNGQAVHAELSPVTDFRESCCRQYEMGLPHPSTLYPGNVPAVVSATSCTCGPSPGTSDVSCMGGDPDAGHPRGLIPATVPEKETDDVPQTTGMVASETLAPLTHS
ncbi:splicing factor U2AF 26 kDa subunit isoform X2 [Canis lupus familiaris]|uniref:splicing factor U2AF 26 kDa subunit isoform X5 n=1 Tax=Canis lupus dingo TaxID=286419 RepID=UPI0015F14257|nr:splicing factor U2AF 26 kDa subunit isoform X5 [Canis lupus dingo]XP_038308946.1 splicing factor U2AF 26 kDa subunit isoform X2 [Canis lupus familiaris]XP_038385213.1 splicing factor U2AF 26 kDa subunit isoform X2 [Canis lupus familiaris]XP_038513324.1 splicing factor U2AF 26 kDa subunit isoform X2 [Canis lupus familiaris]